MMKDNYDVKINIAADDLEDLYEILEQLSEDREYINGYEVIG